MPLRKSNKWIGVFILYTLIVFISIITTRVILNNDLNSSIITRLLLIAFGFAAFPCIAGYFGKHVFYIVYTISVLLGIIYLFYVALGDSAPGWGDLASFVGFIFIIGFGAVLALFAEIALTIITFYRQKK